MVGWNASPPHSIFRWHNIILMGTCHHSDLLAAIHCRLRWQCNCTSWVNEQRIFDIMQPTVIIMILFLCELPTNLNSVLAFFVCVISVVFKARAFRKARISELGDHTNRIGISRTVGRGTQLSIAVGLRAVLISVALFSLCRSAFCVLAWPKIFTTDFFFYLRRTFDACYPPNHVTDKTLFLIKRMFHQQNFTNWIFLFFASNNWPFFWRSRKIWANKFNLPKRIRIDFLRLWPLRFACWNSVQLQLFMYKCFCLYQTDRNISAGGKWCNLVCVPVWDELSDFILF